MPALDWFHWPLVAALGAGSPPTAQPASATSSAVPRIELSAGYELRRDRFRYRFENDSNFDTSFLVPHFFAQSYIADNQWLVGRARYRVAGLEWTSEIAATPTVTAAGDDFDTFFQTDGDVVTSGTAGDVRLRSWSVRQTMRQPIGGRPDASPRLWLVGGYRFRHDRADFLPADRIVTHTRPPMESRTPIATRETTRSHVHDILLGVDFERPIGAHWRVQLSGTLAPTTHARLSTRLPDKYPDTDIVFTALAANASGRVSLLRDWSRWTLGMTAAANRAQSYLAGRGFSADGGGVQVVVGLRP